ncbi:MAG: sulfatase-like hydrolase/transferase [Prosthecobacter sp.]
MRTLIFLLVSAISAFAADQPNILWLVCEDMSPDLGCYGDTYAKTPQIDQFAARSIRFTRAFAESPMCAPSRSALITGMHTGPLGTSMMRSAHPVPTAYRGFPAWLRQAGYYTSNNAKTDYNLFAPNFVQTAWDESSKTAHWRKRPAGKPFFSVFNYGDTHQSMTSRDNYADFVKKVQSRLSPGEIHDPAKVPLPPYYPDTPTARRTVARYYDCISTLDVWVRDMLRDLEADGLAQDTIVFFYSDHGAGMPGGKAATFARGLRVPLLVHFPEKFRHLAPAAKGTVSDRLVSFVDFGPTVLALAGLKVPEHMQGRPFLGSDIGEPSKFVYGTRDRMDETLETTRWISDGRYHLVRSFDTQPPADQQTLLSCYNSNGELCREIRALKAAGSLNDTQRKLWGDSRPPLMFFDTQSDPWCVNNLSNDPAHREHAATMLAELDGLMLRDLDLGFWPEPERVTAENGHSAHLRAHRDKLYPLERIFPIAKLVGQGEQHRSTFIAALADTDASVRYWAAVGLAALGGESAPLRPLLKDSAASVRIVAAEVLLRSESNAEALDLLAAELDSRNEWAATRAARALELLGEEARPKLDMMRDVLKRRTSGFFGKQGPDPVNYGLEFSLTMALKALGK